MMSHDLDSFAALVDARPETDYENGHLPRAISLSQPSVALDAETELPDKTASIGVYGEESNDEAAHQVAAYLRALDYQNVTVLPVNVRQWHAAGGELAFGPARWKIVNACAC